MNERVYRYSIDFEGRISHAGSAIDDPAVIRQLLARVHRDPRGVLFSLCAGERNELAPADALYVIARFDDTPCGEPGAERLAVTCQGGLVRHLDLGTLVLRGGHHLYGEVEGGFAARFGRHAWLEFATRFVDALAEPPLARLSGRAWPIALAAGG